MSRPSTPPASLLASNCRRRCSICCGRVIRPTASFADFFKDNPLVMDQWFSVQAACALPGALQRVEQLMQHPAFTLKNPNKVRSLIGAFAGQNLLGFHQADGSGYRFLADQVITLNALNPQIASRLLAPLT